MSETAGSADTCGGVVRPNGSYRRRGEPDARIFYELYEDEAAFRKHEDRPHVRRFLTGREGLLAGRPRVEFLRSGLGQGWPARTV